MSVGVIIIIAVAATGVLMMRFRKRWLAKINIAFTNRITGLFAGWLPGFGILTHVGRKSGKVYRTPVNVFRASNGFIIALTYGSFVTRTLLSFIRILPSARCEYTTTRKPDGNHAAGGAFYCKWSSGRKQKVKPQSRVLSDVS
ncbi:MAG: hypothetical protein WCA27_18330 [Candidatus Sulfotelmatobacter sp.]